MASYRIEWKPSALKELHSIPQHSVIRIVATVEENPFPPGSRKLTGGRSSYRIREGVYRVIYTIKADLLLIEIVKVGHRKDVYK